MREKVLDICQELDSSVDFSSTTLIDGGELDSVLLVELVSELMEEFEIEIPYEDIVPENFNSVDAITALVERYV